MNAARLRGVRVSQGRAIPCRVDEAEAAYASHPKSGPGRSPLMTRLTPLAFLLLALAAVAGFWKPYLAQLASVPLPLMHVHAALMAAWCVLLVAQPLLVGLGLRLWHRGLGRSAWGLAPAIVMVSLALAVQVTRPAPGAAIEPFRYGLVFLQVATALIFAACVAMALKHRHDPALHGRWMVASGLTFVDSIFARVFAHLAPPWPGLAEHGSVLLSLAVPLALMVAERRSPRGRRVFGALLAMLVPMHAATLVIGDWAPWRRWLEAVLVA